MDKLSKRLYMREHSNVIRKFQSLKHLDKMEENPVFNIDGTNRLIIVTICRIRQRMLTQAWRILTHNTGVKHDYELDARVILSRKLPDDELRTELEIETLFKWIYSTKDIDPTGIANTIYLCKKRSAVYSALQQLRLEFYEPGETVLFQGDIPRAEDGHFTIFNGVCEVLQFPDESMPLMKLLYLAKKRKWDEAKKLLKQALILARITKFSGFGELSTLTGVKRAATIRTDPNSRTPVEVLVLPKQALLDCLKSRRQDGVEGAAPSEAMDFMRQSGLANRISPKDLVRVAQSMIRRTLLQGEILYFKNETVKSLFLVVSGELLLDTGDFMLDGQAQPFINSNPDNCFHMPSGSILGDEGVTGQSNRFESTAVVVSDAAVVFEAVDFGMTFLTEKIGALRYCALTYRDKSRWSPAIQLAEEINPYTYFHSLRKAIAFTHPYRGSRPKIYDEYVEDTRIAKKQGATGTTTTTTTGTTSSTRAGRRKTSSSGGSVRSAGSSSGAPHGHGHGPGRGKHGLKGPGKKLAPLTRLNSNLAFMLAADKHDNTHTSSTTEFNLSRKLKPVGMHHALDINRSAKKLAQKFIKVHAQENILYDEMTKNLSNAAPGAELEEAETKFKNYIAEYRERAVKHAAQVNKEMERERLSRAYTSSAASVKFYGALSPENSDNESVNEYNEHHSDVDSISQKKPFSSQGGDRKNSKLSRSRSRSEDEHSPLYHASSLDKPHGSRLNASSIERELARALEASDEQAQQGDNIHAGAVDTESALSLASYEDEYFHCRPKIVQYFIWMDHLNRHTYRALLQQAQQTIDHNFVKVAEQKLAVTDKTMEELNQIFNRFGLTPTDMNIPWRGNTPKTGRTSEGVQFEGDEEDRQDEEEMRAAELHSLKIRPTAPGTPVPALDMASNKDNIGNNKILLASTKLKSLKPEDAPRGRVNIPGKLIVYHPSSWRHELTSKKDKVTKESYRLFVRSVTPDNRRICNRYFHYPGHHHPDFFAREGQHGAGHHPQHHAADRSPHRTVSGKYSGKSSPYQSRPSTAQSALQLNDPTAMALKAHQEHLEQLQATFNDEPDKFFEAIECADFAKRKEHLPKHEWSTRFMQTSGNANSKKPEPEKHEKIYRKSTPNLKPLPTRPPAASANFSKQSLLNSARAIQAENEQKYALTDSATILEAALNRIKLRAGRDSFLYSSSTKTAKTDFTDFTAEEEDFQGAMMVRTDSQDFDLDHDPEENSPQPSLGNASNDEADEGYFSADGMRPEGDTQFGERLPDDPEGWTSQAHSSPLDAGQASAVSVAPTTGRDSIADEEYSVGNGTANEILDHSQLSPVAPAPSHLDESMYSDNSHVDAHLHAALHSPLHRAGTRKNASPPPVLSSTLEHSQSLLSSAQTTARPYASPHKQSSEVSAFGTPPPEGSRSDVNAARIREAKERIHARGSSVALEQFNKYMNTDNNPRAFYVGKKKASANSKFGLSNALKGFKCDPGAPNQEEIFDLRTYKNAYHAELAMFNSLFPHATEAQRKVFVEKCTAKRANGDTVTPAVTIEMMNSLAESHSKMSVADLNIDAIVTSAKAHFLTTNTAGASGKESLADQEKQEKLAESEEEEDLDPDVVLWQSLTIDLMHKEKTGPKKILPVLIMKNEGGASSRRFAVNKSKRWGSGVLLQLAAEAEEQPISGPPTYLDIFKNTQRRRLREKDRLRITEELKALAK